MKSSEERRGLLALIELGQLPADEARQWIWASVWGELCETLLVRAMALVDDAPDRACATLRRARRANVRAIEARQIARAFQAARISGWWGGVHGKA